MKFAQIAILIAAGCVVAACKSNPQIQFVPAPSAPTMVTATAGTASVALAWAPNPAAEQIDHYVVYRANAPWDTWNASMTGAFATNTTCCSFVATGLQNETTYWFAISASNGRGEGPHSNEISAMPPGWKGPTVFGTAGRDYASSLVLLPSGDLMIGGETNGDFGTQVGGFDWFLQRVSAQGALGPTIQFGTFADESQPYLGFLGSEMDFVASTFGSYGGGNLGQDDIAVASMDTAGSVRWKHLIGSGNEDYVVSIAVDSSGGILTAGLDTGPLYSQQYQGGEYDGLALKIDNGGTLAWVALVGSTNDDQAEAVGVDAENDAIVTGFARASVDGQVFGGTPGGYDAFVKKFDSMGTSKWTREFGGPGDGGDAIAVDRLSDTSFVVGSSADRLGTAPYFSSYDVYALALDSNGNDMWRSFVPLQSGGVSAAAISPDGTMLFVTGNGQGVEGTSGVRGSFVLALDAQTGTFLWGRMLGDSPLDYSTAVAAGPSGTVFVLGYSSSSFEGRPFAGQTDCFLVKCDRAGSCR